MIRHRSFARRTEQAGDKGDRQIVNTVDAAEHKLIYWHGELPPADAEIMGEHVVEASSRRVSSTLAHRDELWEHCYEDLMAHARERLEQEVARLGGDYAHVLDESVDSRHDPVSGEAWLQGQFTYVLYRQKKTR